MQYLVVKYKGLLLKAEPVKVKFEPLIVVEPEVPLLTSEVLGSEIDVPAGGFNTPEE